MPPVFHAIIPRERQKWPVPLIGICVFVWKLERDQRWCRLHCQFGWLLRLIWSTVSSYLLSPSLIALLVGNFLSARPFCRIFSRWEVFGPGVCLLRCSTENGSQTQATSSSRGENFLVRFFYFVWLYLDFTHCLCSRCAVERLSANFMMPWTKTAAVVGCFDSVLWLWTWWCRWCVLFEFAQTWYPL